MSRRLALLSVPAVVFTVVAIAHTQTPIFDMKKLITDEVAKCPQQPEAKKGAELCDPNDGAARCVKWDPLISNKCVNQANNLLLKDITDYSLFGSLDCAVNERGRKKRELKQITHIVVHNGGYDPKSMVSFLRCKGKDVDDDGDYDKDASSAPHYTIDRSGKIFQLVGEEYITVHANGANAYSIGVEMNFPKPGKGNPNCNDMRNKNPDEQVKRLCSPTPEQYKALDRLIAAVGMRTSVTRDVDHVIGHCEVSDSTHGDPRAFDWSKVGLSNQAKRDRLKRLGPKNHVCAHYDVIP